MDINIEKRFNEWHRLASELARKMNLNIEFTTTLSGRGYMSYEVPLVEVSGVDPDHGYYSREGYLEFN